VKATERIRKPNEPDPGGNGEKPTEHQADRRK